MIAVYDLGIDANTSNEILKRFDVEAEARDPKIIIFATGINESSYRKTKDNPTVSVDQFETNLKELISKANKYTDKIFMLGLCKGSDEETVPLPRSTTGKCYTKENSKKYDEIIKKVAHEEGVTYIGVYEKLADEDFDDGLHPNLGGHQKIFEEVRRTIKSSV
jgi:lysophospholipase L1-like esterase